MVTAGLAHDLELPKVTGKRERVATPEEALLLIAAAPKQDGQRHSSPPRVAAS